VGGKELDLLRRRLPPVGSVAEEIEEGKKKDKPSANPQARAQEAPSICSAVIARADCGF